MPLDATRPDPQPEPFAEPFAEREARERLGHERATRLAQLKAFDDAGHAPGDALVAERKASIGQVLEDIDKALARLDQGEYGVCQGCSRAIPPERLEILPYARCCVGCQRHAA
ncbi:TraR/DksA C4-type zinc finger protein [Streptomyces sp. NPDC046821]|uniref:TraR/DksA family transcriptional regulator n=1 Tax=Streptomyces sp. NPDC046821 TaxID=3154702 RepID=UPI0033D4158E